MKPEINLKWFYETIKRYHRVIVNVILKTLAHFLLGVVYLVGVGLSAVMLLIFKKKALRIFSKDRTTLWIKANEEAFTLGEDEIIRQS